MLVENLKTKVRPSYDLETANDNEKQTKEEVFHYTFSHIKEKYGEEHMDELLQKQV